MQTIQIIQSVRLQFNGGENVMLCKAGKSKTVPAKLADILLHEGFAHTNLGAAADMAGRAVDFEVSLTDEELSEDNGKTRVAMLAGAKVRWFKSGTSPDEINFDGLNDYLQNRIYLMQTDLATDMIEAGIAIRLPIYVGSLPPHLQTTQRRKGINFEWRERNEDAPRFALWSKEGQEKLAAYHAKNGELV